MSLSDRLTFLLSPRKRLARAIRLSEAGAHARAFPELARAAEAGHPEAADRVGRAYLQGAGVPASRIEGARWLGRAAEAGWVDAQTALATLLLTGGLGGSATDREALFGPALGRAPDEVDHDAALRWARRAAAEGSPEAQALVGYILTSGPEHLRDAEAGDDAYRRSAAAGDPRGRLGHALALLRHGGPDAVRQGAVEMGLAAAAGLPTALYLLGVMRERGAGLERDGAEAIRLYGRAAAIGHRSAQARLGLAMVEGHGVARNVVEGESWLRRAAVAGDVEAAALIGDLYARGGDLPPNYAEAAMWYGRAAAAGHAAAARQLGLLHLTGAGVPRDPDEAARWFGRASEGGDAAATRDLADLVNGGVSDDGKIVARSAFEIAARSGDLLGAFNFGLCLAEGVGVARDERRAMLWLRRAADGIVNAQYWYGRMVLEGRGVEADPAEGQRWIARAAERGMPDAQVLYGMMLVDGRAGQRDHALALEMFGRAAASGHVGAMFSLGAINGGGHDVAENRTLARQWFLRGPSAAMRWRS